MNAERKDVQAQSLSQTPNRDLTAKAREALKGRWGIAVGTTALYFLILVFLSFVPVLGGLISALITGSLLIGLNRFFLGLTRKQEVQVGQLFSGFSRFGAALGAYALIGLFVMLWSLLLIIPGIIASLAYSMTFYIMAEDESIKPMAAIKMSKAMMIGNKWKLFCLGWRFIGWALLCILTLGIGLLWLMPYQMASFAEFYRDLKKEAL